MTVTPIGARQLASPVIESAIGSIPATIATVVITMGCARLCPAFVNRFVLGHSVVHHLDCEIDQKDRVLCDDSEQHQDSDEDGERHRLSRNMECDCSAQRSENERAHIHEWREESPIKQDEDRKDEKDARHQRDCEIIDELTLPFLIAQDRASERPGEDAEASEAD